MDWGALDMLAPKRGRGNFPNFSLEYIFLKTFDPDMGLTCVLILIGRLNMDWSSLDMLALLSSMLKLNI